MPYYQLYRLDQDTWMQVASLCSPWSGSESWLLLTQRMFRVMDTDQDGLITFLDMLHLLDMMCGGEVQRAAKLLYCLHLPGVVLKGELEEAGEGCGPPSSCGATVPRRVHTPPCARPFVWLLGCWEGLLLRNARHGGGPGNATAHVAANHCATGCVRHRRPLSR